MRLHCYQAQPLRRGERAGRNWPPPGATSRSRRNGQRARGRCARNRAVVRV